MLWRYSYNLNTGCYSLSSISGEKVFVDFHILSNQSEKFDLL